MTSQPTIPQHVLPERKRIIPAVPSPLPNIPIPHKHQPPMQHSSSKRKIPMRSHVKNSGEAYDNHSQSRSYSQVSKQHGSFSRNEQSVQLHQKLKNLHLFYKEKIESEKAQTVHHNNVFLGIIQEMQRSHQVKVDEMKKLIEQAEGEKKDVGLVDQRMNEIKGSIDQILHQSAELKVSNDKLQRQINQKQHSLREKEEQLAKLKEELMDSRNQLQTFQRLNLKENKRNKQIFGVIDKAVHSNHPY